ncbi:hypothetical protein [Marinomonas ostreistagni]|uniref:hypothetical protein n=1 Tax=Marinomonas ostreistagni TaxID=359209 RepID=UPI00194E820D|nr:hypothetical protein [Marinomonas ostreistagni]MBM6552168.1 hypothetical protein [Marinomonas ostreistagni]
MKKFVTAALLLAGATSAVAAGQFSPLVSYENIFSEPSDSVDSTSGIVRANMEYSFPRSLALYGGLAFADRDSVETAVNVGARFYSTQPLLNNQVPVWGYLGAGVDFWDHAAFYPEVGLRFGITDQARLDVFVRTYNSNDLGIDDHTSLGVGLTF